MCRSSPSKMTFVGMAAAVVVVDVVVCVREVVVGAVPAREVVLPLELFVLVLLLEHPDTPITNIAAPAAATVSPRFTCSPLQYLAVHRL
jgi:hypothetical protein